MTATRPSRSATPNWSCANFTCHEDSGPVCSVWSALGAAHARAENVTQADDANDLVALEHGEVPEAAGHHRLGCVLGVGVGCSRLGVPRHPFRYTRAREVATGRGGSQHVALGEDADEHGALRDERRTEP